MLMGVLPTKQVFGKSLILASALVALATGAAVSQPSTIVLVRHGEKAMDPPSDPPLSPAGQLRARELMHALADAKVSAIITTQFARTRLTGKPLADSLHVTPVVVATPNLKAQIDSIVGAVKSAKKGSTVLVVGHSNTVPLIIAALGGPKLPDLCDAEYSNLFVLEMSESGSARLIRGHFGATDPPDADGCRRMSR
jgi:broad specificity phosphatase PhoE